MRRWVWVWIIFGFLSGKMGYAGDAAQAKPVVVLLHGIMNKPFVMDRIASRLTQEGYDVHNWGYASTDALIEDHAARVYRFIQTLPADRPLHFVGFSQGAIIIRYTLTHYPVPNAKRFVMIAPPNHGCEIAEDFYQYAWFRGLYGDKSIKQLFAHQNDFLKTCGIPKIDFGIIAGGKGDSEGYSKRIPGDDDGTVSVESARLEGAKDFVLLPYPHTPLVFASSTVSQVAHFLAEGAFKK